MSSRVNLVLATVALVLVIFRTGASPVQEASTSDGAQPVPVLVELFTSEGCSSCPPADRLLTRLAQSQPVEGAEIIALGFHVDYWNYIGWTDRFSSRKYSDRQSWYAGRFDNDSVYTPQMVVDGRAEFVGSDEAEALRTVAAAVRIPKVRVVLEPGETERKGADQQTVSLQIRVDDLSALPSNETAQVWFALTEDDLESRVTRGENSGRRLVHNAVVRKLERIGKLKREGSREFRVETKLGREWRRAHLGAVAFVQEERSGRVLGAATLRLEERELNGDSSQPARRSR